MQRSILLTLAGCLLLVVAISPADADTISVLPGPHDNVEVLQAPTEAPPVVMNAEPYPATAHAVCCPKPRLKYRNALRLFDHSRCRCGCVEKTTVVLSVPTACCPVEVPVCVPACCEIVPQLETDRGLFGRCVYRYCWPNGYTVKIVERKHLGDYLVICDAR